MILAIDPSSSKTGFCLHTGKAIVEAGVIKPNKSDLPAIVRSFQMSRDVADLVAEFKDRLECVIVELPPPTQGKARMNPSVQHQAFGMVMYVIQVAGVKVSTVHPATWTRNRSKEVWADSIRRRYPALANGSDQGFDAAAAIGIAEWFFTIGRFREPVSL